MRKVHRVLAGIFIGCTLCTTSFADEVNIPFAIKTERFKKDLKKAGFDFYGKDDSLGFVESRGMTATVFSYKSLSIKQLDAINIASQKNIRK